MILAELLSESARSTFADLGLVAAGASASIAVGVRWLRHEIRSEVTAQTREIHTVLTEMRADMRADMRPNGGKSGADAISLQTAQLVAEILRRHHDDADPS